MADNDMTIIHLAITVSIMIMDMATTRFMTMIITMAMTIIISTAKTINMYL